MMRLIRCVVALACAVPASAFASDTDMCRDGTFEAQDTTFELAKVIGTPRTWLRSDLPPCPDETAACRGRAYVVPGDVVLTGMTSGAYVCAYFAGRNGGSTGYVRRDEITPLPKPVPPLAAWTGHWRDGDNSIVLRADDGALTVSGDAYWPSARPSPSYRPGGPNVGDLSGTATPNGNTVVFGDVDPDSCRVALTLLPPFLLAVDNRMCGGMNVSFTGVYRKR